MSPRLTRDAPPDDYEVLRAEVDADADAEAAPEDREVDWWWPPLAELALTLSEPASELRASHDHRERWSYLVVDEDVDDLLDVAVAAWPIVDREGRLVFRRDGSESVTVPLADFQEWVAWHRRRAASLGLFPEAAVEQRVTIGDTFAAPFAGRFDGDLDATYDFDDDTGVLACSGRTAPGRRRSRAWRLGLPPDDVPGLLVLDITHDAREAGKVAHHAAMSGTLDSGVAHDAAVLDLADERAIERLGGPGR